MALLLSLLLGAALAASEPAPAAPGAQAEPPARAAAAEPDTPLPAAERVKGQALAYAQKLAEGRAGTYAFKVVAISRVPASPKGELVFEAAHVSRSDLAGRFFVSFNALLEGRIVGMVRVDLDGSWTGRLLRLRESLPRQAVPTEAQVEAFDFEGTPPAGALHELPAGFRLRSQQLQGHILAQSDLEAIPLVIQGEPVRLEVVDGDLTIVVDAVARSSGASGDKVRLEMPSSRKLILARVTGPGEARVLWSGSK